MSPKEESRGADRFSNDPGSGRRTWCAHYALSGVHHGWPCACVEEPAAYAVSRNDNAVGICRPRSLPRHLPKRLPRCAAIPSPVSRRPCRLTKTCWAPPLIPMPRGREALARRIAFANARPHIGTAHGAGDVTPTMRSAGGTGNTG